MGGKTVTTESYMEDVKKIHEGKGYEYKSDWEYIHSKCPIEVKCPEHGWWTTKAYSHRGMKSGCPTCAEISRDARCDELKRGRLAREYLKVIKRQQEKDDHYSERIADLHGSSIEIVSECLPEGCHILLRCRKHDRIYYRNPNKLKNKGCEFCSEEAQKTNSEHQRKTTEQVIREFKNVHGDHYDYSRVEYKNSLTKVEIICRYHDSFWMTPNNHITMKSGCRECYLESRGDSIKRPDEDWVTKFKAVHGNKYEYDEAVNIRSDSLCKIRCYKHGIFELLPRRHYSGWGCYWCDVPSSGFKVYLPASLYYLKITCPETGKNYYKIGVTNYKDVNQRFFQQSKETYEILKEWRYSIGRYALNREVALLRKYKEDITADDLEFWKTAGKTEIFSRDVLNYDKVLK